MECNGRRSHFFETDFSAGKALLTKRHLLRHDRRRDVVVAGACTEMGRSGWNCGRRSPSLTHLGHSLAAAPLGRPLAGSWTRISSSGASWPCSGASGSPRRCGRPGPARSPAGRRATESCSSQDQEFREPWRLIDQETRGQGPGIFMLRRHGDSEICHSGREG